MRYPVYVSNCPKGAISISLTDRLIFHFEPILAHSCPKFAQHSNLWNRAHIPCISTSVRMYTGFGSARALPHCHCNWITQELLDMH